MDGKPHRVKFSQWIQVTLPMIALLVGFGPPLLAQVDSLLYCEIPTQTFDTLLLGDCTTYWEEGENPVEIEELLAMPFQTLGKDFSLRTNHRPIWLKIHLENPGADSIQYHLNLGGHMRVRCWNFRNGDLIENGLYVPLPGRSSRLRSRYLPISMAPKERNTYLIRIQDFMEFGKRVPIDLRNLDTFDTLGKLFLHQKLELFSSIFVLSITFFLCLFTLIQYFNFRDKVYLYYSLYLLTMFLQFLKALEYLGFYHVLFSYTGMANLYLDVLIDIIPLFFYAGFVIHFLKIDQEESQTYRQIQVFLGGIGSLLLGNLLLLVIGNYSLASQCFVFTWGIEVIGSLWLLYLLSQRLSVPFASYILLGSAILILGGACSFGISLIRRLTDVHISSPLLPLRIGFLLEIFCFSYTLGLRMKDNERQKKQAQLDLEQSKMNLLEAEIKALKAQMNPHFISNCLNSIKALIQQGRAEEAITYLIRFSKLIRSVVDYSLLPEITLRQELKLSKLYLELESLRLGHNFRYEMEWESSELDLDFFQIPPFLLQPFLENAIWHGFRGRELAQNTLRITIEEREAGLCCLIEDNGIGREKAFRLHKEPSGSIGIRNVEERLALLEKLQDMDLRVEVIDLYDSQDRPLGTRVELLLGY